jgi:L-gulonolactone oxidase
MQPMDKEIIRLSDWSGFTDFGGSKQVYAPTSEEDVARLVRACLDNNQRLRVVGLQTSWNTLWYCDEVMMTTKRLNAIKNIDVQEGTITCETGVTLAEVHRALWKKGLTLKTAPGIDWVTVGGAISTGSHGSGGASISSNMIRCRLVTASGEIIEIGEGDDRLDAVRISLGLLGVLTSVTLRAVSAFDVSVKGMRVPTSGWKRFLTEGEMSYMLCFPHTGYSVLMRVDVLDRPVGGPNGTNQEQVSPEVADDMKRAKDGVIKLAQRSPTTFPARNRYLLDVFFRDFESSGPAHEMLMSYTSDPIAGGEWAVPAEQFGAVLDELQSERNGFYLPAIWLKRVEGESAWLRAADGLSVQCGIYHDVIAGAAPPLEAMVRRVEQIMLRHGGRPHLGKLIYMTPSELKQAYPGWAKFDDLRRRMDPKGLFWSKAIAARFGNATNDNSSN